MATKWYFTDTTESSGYTEKSTDTANKTETNAGNLKKMTAAQGAGVVTPSITNNSTSAEKWFFRAFVSPKLAAQTVAAGTVTFRAAPIESNSNLNHAMRWYAYVLRGGSNVATIAGPADEATESSATAGTANGREHAVSYSSFTLQENDQIVVEMWSSGTASMTTNYTHQPAYGGSSEITEGANNASPASNVEFTATISLHVDPVAFGASGANATGTTSLSVAYPTGIAAGNLLVLAVVNKYPTNGPSTPSGWTLASNAQVQGGSGPSGADSGSVYVTVFYKVADGSETGNLSVTITSGNAAAGRMLRYVRGTGNAWSVAACNGTDTSPDTTWGPVSGNVNPGITADDVILVVTGSNSDRIDFTSPSLSATSATIAAGTERAQDKVASGDQLTIYIVEFLCTAGTGSAAPSYTHNNGSSAADDPCGATVMFRMRAITNSWLPSAFAMAW